VRLSVSIEQGGATVTLNDLLLRCPGRRVAVPV
jgi:hypothetical protein